MIRATRVPRPSRPVLLTILVTALLAFPMGIVLASHQFSDVPNSNPFHADVDALVDSGVTAGCGGGKYCPNNSVTRGQMAVFLNKLGALGAGTLTNVDALSVNGIVPEFANTTLTVSASEASHCEVRTNATGASDFVAFVQLISPATPSAIDNYAYWVTYDGVDPDEFNVCVSTVSGGNLPTGQYVVQIGTLEFIGQQLFSSTSGARKAERVAAKVREAHEK